MEPDEMKAAWHVLEQRISQDSRIRFELLRDSKLRRARKSLRPLYAGQVIQMLFGLPFVLLASWLWMRAGSVPLDLPAHVIAAGVFVHAYGILTIVMAGCTLGQISRIDYTAPVLSIEKQLSKLRSLYIVNGMLTGLPWWLMWVPVLMVLAALAGIDLYARAPSMVWIGLGVGVAGLLATFWFHRWSRSPKRPQLARKMEDSVTGSSLRDARRILAEISRFEQE